MTRLVEILVAVNAALGIITWLSVRWAQRRRRSPTRTIDAGPRQLPPPASDDVGTEETSDPR